MNGAYAEWSTSELRDFVTRFGAVVPTLVVVVDLAERRIRFASDSVERFTGIALTTLLGTSGVDTVVGRLHPDDLAELRDGWASPSALHVASERLRRGVRFADAVGLWRWLRVRVAPFRVDADGSTREVLLLADDVTTRREEEERLIEVQRIAMVGDWEIDCASGMAHLGPEARRIFDTPGSVHELEWLDSQVHPEDRVALREALVAIADGGPTLDLVARVGSGAGARRVVVRARRRAPRETQPPALLGTIHDVTEAEQAEQERRVFHAAIEASLNAIAIADLSGRLSYVNPAFARLWRLADPVEAIGTSAFDYWADPREAIRALGVAVVEGSWVGRLIGLRGDGTTAVIQVSAQRVEGGPSGAPRVMTAFVDVTAEVQAAERVTAQLAEKEVLLREIHHRVKNNLQVVSSFLYLQSLRFDDPRVRAAYEDGRARVRVMALVHEALYRSPDLNRVEVGLVIRSLVDGLLVSHQVDGVDVRAEVSVDGRHLPIETAVPVGLIVNELVTNALKHAFVGRNRGRVWVTHRADGAENTLEVRDDGVGFGHTTSGSQAVGLEIVRALTGQLEGSLDLRGCPGARARVTWRGMYEDR